MSDVIAEAGGSEGATVATLRYKGVFDFDGMTTYLINWFKKRDFQINEKKHKHKMSCPHGFEVEWNIEAFKKIDDYYKHYTITKMHLWDAYQVDAVKDGKKIKLWSARIEIKTQFKVECDYQGRWEKKPWLKKLRNFYDQYIIKKEIIAKHADPLYFKLLELHTELKKFIGMESTTYL